MRPEGRARHAGALLGQRDREHETARQSVQPGPIRTRMRAIVFPGEDPMTLDTPEQAAEFIVPMCAPEWTETGKLYDYKTRTLMSFRPPE